MIKLEESISAREGVSCFPSRQCSIRLCSTATTNLSHSSLSRKTKVQSFSLSLSLSLKLPHTIVHPIPHIHTPSKHLNYNEVQQRSSTIYNPTIFSINHRSTPWLVNITQIIDLGLESLVDISCIGMYVCKHIPADNTTYACPRIYSSRTKRPMQVLEQIDRVRGRV